MLIGTGPMSKEVKKYVEEKKLSENVRFLGNRNDMPDLYMAMDVFIFPSLFEGLGIVGVEAQASGTPVICTKSLPKEIDVTPIIRRLELGNPVEWADMAIKLSMINEAHKDMHSYIEKAQYDIVGLSRWLQNYYLNCYKEINMLAGDDHGSYKGNDFHTNI